MTTDQQTSGPVEGWYPDPLEQADLRWFDGAAWTEQTRANPSSSATGSADVVTDRALSDAELLALIAAQDRKRRTIGLGVLALVVVAAIAWFALGGEDAPSAGPSTDGASSVNDAPIEPGVQGRVEGEAIQPDDPNAAAAAAEQATATNHVAGIVRAMRTCATSNEDGSFAGCTTERLLEISPSLRPVLDACGAPGGGCVKPIKTDGYEVRVQDTASPPRTWIEIHTAGGSATRTCEPAGCTPDGSW